METVIDPRGRIVIPEQIREQMNLKPGIRLDVSMGENGKAVISKVHRRNVGLIKTLGKLKGLEAPVRKADLPRHVKFI